MSVNSSKPSFWLSLISSVVVGLTCGGVGYYHGLYNNSEKNHSENRIFEIRTPPALHDALIAVSHVVQRALKKATEPSKDNVMLWLILSWIKKPKLLWFQLALYYLHVAAVQDEESPKDEEPKHDDGSAKNLSREANISHINNDMPSGSTANMSGRYLEMLVHNVSHTDLVLSVDVPKASDSDDEEDYCLCQPRFSAFDLYSTRILKSLESSNHKEIVSFPKFERSQQTLRYPFVQPSPSRRSMIPTGFFLSNSVLTEDDTLRFRGRDVPRVETCQTLALNHVFFPLLATLLPKWHGQMKTKQYAIGIKKVIVLVSGVGTPRNWTHSVNGNSTRACAELMEHFIHELYPDVTVVRIHSDTNIFRYDENMSFAHRELLPCIEAYRDAHARNEPYPDETAMRATDPTLTNPFSPDWKQSFAVTLSFADGSHARTHAIQSALKSYRPTYFHVWQLKTFWHDVKICEDDIEVHSFEDMEGVPAIDTSSLGSEKKNNREKNDNDEDLKLVVEEMNSFRQEFCHSVSPDLFRFWLRKTKKPVLAVLLVETHDKQTKLYRGTNMEVSMPTGSLCAERNVIGTALAANPCLTRQDLRMIAVLSVSLPRDSRGAGGSSDSLTCYKTNSVLKSRSADPIGPSASMESFSSFIQQSESNKSLIVEEEGPVRDEDWVLQQAPLQDAGNSKKSESSTRSSSDKREIATREIPEEDRNVVTVLKSPRFSPAVSESVPPAFDMPPPLSLVSTTTSSKTPPGTPRRVISLYSNPYEKTQQKRKVVVNSSEDLNPLRPCGSCNEWLKKIAESNPYFKVVTFTDADCSGVYVSPCQE